jgi:DNA repair protein RadC
MLTSAFTCTGPYAVLIMLGIKRVENRSAMPEPAKGRCAVCCSKSFCREEYGNFVQWASRALPPEDFELIPSWSDVAGWPGRIVGACDYEARGRNDLRLEGESACAARPPYQWDEGYECWWHLSNVVCFDAPIPCRGNVGMWQMPSALAAQVTAADALTRSVGEKVASADAARRLFALAAHVAGKSEGLFMLPLDAERRALAAPVLVSLGTETTTAIQPSAVFAEAIKVGANSIIVAHNHPSGDLTPSKADIAATKELKDLAARLKVGLLDHLIVNASSPAFRSLAEEGVV